MSFVSVSIDNVSDGETVHQRCLLIKGQCSQLSEVESDFISISTADASGTTAFPVQTWPVFNGRFKALLLLSPGANVANLQHYRAGQAHGSYKLHLTYLPPLQNPPLHLAIMVAKDSPLTIDCPMIKRGGISSAHSSLEAAIAKFRMTAYMWQALTGDDMHSKGLGRRSFRLEEEWAADSLSQAFPHAGCVGGTRCSNETAVRSTAKIHIVRSDKTVAELRHAQLAQQNPKAHRKDDLHKFFVLALKQYGGPFASIANPVVAGLILDSTYSASQDLILAHAAVGTHTERGISLAMFGSHLTYSWPRFVEEVPACLLDTTLPGDDVGNDCGECGSMWEACAIGQGSFLQTVGSAFGASSNTGIMARGYAQHWPRNFLARTAYRVSNCEEGIAIDDGTTENNARWALCDALTLRLSQHFGLSTDMPVTHQAKTALPTVHVEADGGTSTALVITSAASIALVEFNSVSLFGLSVQTLANTIRYTLPELERRFERTVPLDLYVLGLNGRELHHRNVWKLFANTTVVRVPGSDVVLKKRAISDDTSEASGSRANEDQWDWAVLLKERGKDGKVVAATSIDMRVGCVLDGAIVHFEDRHTSPCGPRWSKSGQHHHFGGHASQRIYLPSGVDIFKLELSHSWSQFQGMRITLSNGMVKGELNSRNGTEVHVLEPSANEKIVGFYGHSDWQNGWGGPHQFGIITAPKGVELPDAVHDLEELKNVDGGTGPRPGRDNVPVPMEGIEGNGGESEDEEEEGEEEDEEEEGEGNDDQEDDDEDEGEVFDKLEGEDFGPPEGLAIRLAA